MREASRARRVRVMCGPVPTRLTDVMHSIVDSRTTTHHAQPTEMACLDYVPSVAIRPVDMTERLRPKKAHRKIRMLIGALPARRTCVAAGLQAPHPTLRAHHSRAGITCYNEDGDELKRTLVRVHIAVAAPEFPLMRRRHGPRPTFSRTPAPTRPYRPAADWHRR